MAFVNAVHASNDAAGTTLAVAYSPITGNLLACAGVYRDNTAAATVADGGINTYTQVDRAIDNTDLFSMQSLYAKNVTGGALTITLTTTSSTFRRFQVAEESGLDKTAPLEDNQKAFSAAFGAGADAATTGNGAGTTSDGDKIVSFYSNLNTATNPSAGTNFSGHDLFNNAAGDAMGYEERVQAVHSATDAATWTTNDAGAIVMVAMMAFKFATTSILTAPMMPAFIWGRSKIQLARPHVDSSTAQLNNYLLAAAIGVYTYAGSAASTLATRLLAAATGVYNLTGAAALLAFGHKLLANAGAYTLTGAAASVLATRLLAATKGTFTLTGAAAAMLYKRILIAGTGVFTLTGAAISIARTYVLGATRGVFSLSGQAASTIYSAASASVADWIVRLRRRRR